MKVSAHRLHFRLDEVYPEPFNEFREGSAEGLSVSSAQDAHLQGECADLIIIYYSILVL